MRGFYNVLFVSALLTACNGNQTPKHEENLKLVSEFYKHFNSHNWQKMAEMYTDTAYFKDPSFGTDIVTQTIAETAEKYAELAKIFPDLKDSVVATYPSGDKHVFVEFISTGTGPDGSKLYLPIATVFTIENGKITNDYTYYDNMEEPPQDSAAFKK